MSRPIVAFVLDRVKDTDEARVRMRVKWDGCARVVAMNVGYRVSVHRWDPEAQRCMPRSYHGARRVPAAEINAEIDRHEEAAREALKECGACPTEQEFREALGEALGRSSSRRMTVLQAFDAFMNERGERNKWTDATYKKMRNVRRHLQEWRPDLTWADFDEAGLFDYVAHLSTATVLDNKTKARGEDKKVRAGLRDSTAEKHVSLLKWFLGWADHKGLLECTDYLQFRPKLQKAEKLVIFLEWSELMTMYQADLSERPELARVRDVFCFCAFTSLRYSDVKALRWSDVYDDHIQVTTQKTSDALRIELNDYSQELLGRYVDEAFPEDRVFPVISNQKMNDRLKELGQLLGFDRLIRVTEHRNGKRHDALVPKWQLLSTHAARRTFICHALMMGIAPNVVMQWTGHADYDSMKPYIAIADSVKASEMAKFNRSE